MRSFALMTFTSSPSEMSLELTHAAHPPPPTRMIPPRAEATTEKETDSPTVRYRVFVRDQTTISNRWMPCASTSAVAMYRVPVLFEGFSQSNTILFRWSLRIPP